MKYIETVSLNELGTLRFTEDLKPIDAIPREEYIKKLTTYLDVWRRCAERIVLDVSVDHIARITEMQWVLNPILEIISNLQKKGVKKLGKKAQEIMTINW